MFRNWIRFHRYRYRYIFSRSGSRPGCREKWQKILLQIDWLVFFNMCVPVPTVVRNGMFRTAYFNFFGEKISKEQRSKNWEQSLRTQLFGLSFKHIIFLFYNKEEYMLYTGAGLPLLLWEKERRRCWSRRSSDDSPCARCSRTAPGYTHRAHGCRENPNSVI